MSLSKTISIALCTYNGEKYIADQIESFLNQTVLPHELIIGDDGSTDSTIEIIERMATKAPFPFRIKVNSKNSGSTKNFEQTIARCSGDIIFLSDQDDVWEKNKVGTILDRFKASDQVSLVFTNAELVDAKLNRLGRDLWKDLFTDGRKAKFESGRYLDVLLFDRNVVTGATVAFDARMTPILLANKVPKGFIHDHWLAVLAALVSKIEFLEECLVKYRQHPNQQIGAVKRRLTNPVNTVSRMDRFQTAIEILESQVRAVSKLRNIESLLVSHHAFAEHFAANRNHLIKLITVREQRYRDQIAHLLARKGLPSSIAKRSSAIFMELRTGRYHDYSNGLRSAVADILNS